MQSFWWHDKNLCIIHTVKLDVQVHDIPITSSGICTNILVPFLVVPHTRFKSPVFFCHVTLSSLKGMDFFLFRRALWLSEESRLFILSPLQKCSENAQSCYHCHTVFYHKYLETQWYVKIMLFVPSPSLKVIQQKMYSSSSAFPVPGKLIYNTILNTSDYPDTSVEQDYRLLTS